MKTANKIASKKNQGWKILTGAAVFAGLAAANLVIARRTELQHPPKGKFVTVQDVKLHYTDEGQGSPVILIHGNLVAGDDWTISGVADLLRKTHRVIIFDRPGCGHSDRPFGRLWTPIQQAELLHEAFQQLGIERPVVVGQSLGATVAIAMAARFQSDITSLVLISGYYFWTLRPDALFAAIGATPILGGVLRYSILPLINWLQMPLLKRVMFSPAKIPEKFEKKYSSAMIVRPSQIRATSVDGALLIPGVLALSKDYKKITVPMEIITGDSDKVVFKRASEKLHALLPQSVLHIVKDAGHMVHHYAPDLVTHAVEKSLIKPEAVAA